MERKYVVGQSDKQKNMFNPVLIQNTGKDLTMWRPKLEGTRLQADEKIHHY